MGERDELERAIAAQEGLRGTMSDAILDTTITALRARLWSLSPEPAVKRPRLVTILFADVSGFTALGETLDAEELSDTFDELWRRIDGTILEWGGTIDKHIGDAVMGTWGIVAAREDDPERAIRAALAIQSAAASMPRSPDRPALSLRVGVNTGTVIVGSLASTQETSTIGDAINVAARLESAAPIGGVLIGHDTYRHVRGTFSVEIREPLVVKGKRHPLRTYVVTGVRPRAFHLRTRGIEGVETRMIGRERELARLVNAVREMVRKGRGSSITVVAEAGLGKSRLLYEFEDWLRVQPDEVRLFKARADEQHRSVPNSTIRDLFFFRFQIAEDDPPGEAARKLSDGLVDLIGREGVDLAPFIGHLIGLDVSDDPAISVLLDDPHELRDRGVRAIARFLRQAALRTPLVALVEDVHWADPGSVELLEQLAVECAEQPIFMVCTARPVLFERTAQFCLGTDRHERIDLPALTAAETSELVDDMLQQLSSVPDVVRSRAVTSAEGNPYFVEEAVRMMIDDGVIVVGEVAWEVHTDRLGGSRVPSTLTGLLQARLDRLATDERTVLQRAAVVGRVFWDDAVPGAGLTPDQITAALDSLETKELIFRQDDADFVGCREYLFKHDVLHRVVYESVLRREQRHHHQSVASWLAARTDGDTHASLVAGHLAAADRPHEAVPWYVAAARRAAERFAMEEAIEHLRSALRPGTLDPVATVSALQQLTDLLVISARYAEAIETAAEMRRAAEAAGDVSQVAMALLDEAIALTRLGRSREALVSAQRADELLRRHAVSDRARVALLVELGWIVLRLGKVEEAVAHGEESLRLVVPEADGRDARAAHSLTGSAYSALGHHEAAAHHLAAAHELAKRLGDRRNETASLANLAELSRLAGDHDSAIARFEQVLPAMRDLGDRDQEALALSNLGGALVGAGRHREAIVVLAAAMDAFEASGSAEHLSESHRFRAEAHLGLGEIELALEAARTAMRLARERENADHLGHAWRVAALTALAAGTAVDGDIEGLDAEPCIEASEQVFGAAGMECELARARTDHARICAARGDLVRAEQLRASARASYRRLGLTRLAATVPAQ